MPGTLVDTLDALGRALEAGDVPGFEAWQVTREHLVADTLRLRRRLERPRSEAVVAIIGATGTGKSTILNSIAEEAVSSTGSLRPTTRRPVIWGARPPAEGGAVPVEGGRVVDGVHVVDAPDFDSTVPQHRILAERWARAAELCVFVTSSKRYADRAAWEMLHLLRRLGIPLYLVVNRVTGDHHGAVLGDYSAALAPEGLFRQVARPRMLLIAEQAVEGERLPSDAVQPLRQVLDELSAPEARERSFRRSLPTRLGLLAEEIETLATELWRQAEMGARLADGAIAAFGVASEELDEFGEGALRDVVAASLGAQAAAAVRVAASSIPGAGSILPALIDLDLELSPPTGAVATPAQQSSRFGELARAMVRQRLVSAELKALARSLRQVDLHG